MKLNEKIPVDGLVFFDKLVDAVNNSCYCERINKNYPEIERACRHCARLNWYVQDLNKVCEKIKNGL